MVTNGLRGYCPVSSDNEGYDILLKEGFNTNCIVTVKGGDYLRMSRCTIYPYSKFHGYYSIDLISEGIMLKGGTDLEPADYKLITIEKKTGNYCIYDSSQFEEIIVEENFSESCYVTIGDGQYIILEDCHVEVP